MRKHLTPGLLALIGILAGALALRLYGLEHGLPFIYHSDESQHFTRYAVAMFDGDLNPQYFQNPTTFTYLVYLALKLHGFDDIASQYLADPSEIYETARLVAVALALLGVAAVYAVGRRLWGAFEGWSRPPCSRSRSCRSRTRATPSRTWACCSAVAVALYAIVMIQRGRSDGATT